MEETLLPVEEALRLVISESSPLGTEEIALERALGRVVAERIVAPFDMPAFDRSAMDGYAVRSEDVANAPVDLEVVGFLPAGRDVQTPALTPGRAIRIMTGAPIPPGADAVQKIERTRGGSDGARVRILERVPAGEHISRRGEDLKGGDLLLESGTRIRSAEIGALAAIGRTRLRVHRLPEASVLSTGDELVEPGATPLPHQIRNSNGPALIALLAEVGLAPRALGIVRDDPADLDARISEGLAGDLLFLIGGVSVGDRDLVAPRLAAMGAREIFHRVAMKPGKPLLLARRDRCLVFGLPGNPLSAFTAFLIFALPAIRGMSGLPAAGLSEVAARLASEIRQKPGRTWYRLARVETEGAGFRATPVKSSGSGDLVSATRANGFIIVPAEASVVSEGSTVRALLW